MVQPTIQIPQFARRSAIGQVSRGICPVWDWEIGDFSMTPDGQIEICTQRSLQQIVRSSLITERGAYLIYDHSYGSDLYELFGEDPQYVRARIENSIRDSLNDPRIYSINVEEPIISEGRIFVTVEIVDVFSDRIIERVVV
jgi:hypothetical protein